MEQVRVYPKIQPIEVNQKEYKRIEHFNYFRHMANPYVGVTCEVDITNFYHRIKERRKPFFLSLLWCMGRAANEVREFRQRIEGNKIIEYSFCYTSHTVAKEDGTYSYCMLDERMEYEAFIQEAEKKQNQAKQYGTLEEENDPQSLLFISSLPWLHFTELRLPTPIPADSNPRITLGKYMDKDGKIVIPVSTICNHALVDGRNIAEFYQKLEQQLNEYLSFS